jgi:hypothetical protein
MAEIKNESIMQSHTRHPWVFIGWILMLGYAFRTGAYRREYQAPTVDSRRKRERDIRSVQRQGEEILREKEIPHYDNLTLANLWGLFKRAFSRWNEDHAQQLPLPTMPCFRSRLY